MKPLTIPFWCEVEVTKVKPSIEVAPKYEEWGRQFADALWTHGASGFSDSLRDRLVALNEGKARPRFD
jgi:hypothetical protein